MKIAAPPRSGFPGLSLRQIERADLDAWYAYLTNPDVYRHTSWNLRSPDDRCRCSTPSNRRTPIRSGVSP